MSQSSFKKNWSKDEYSSILIQRNLIIIFSIFLSFSLMISLIILKKFYNSHGVEPYIIEYNNQSGLLTKVDAKTKQEYTANQTIKESILYQYINNREKVNIFDIEEKINFIRINSTSEIYSEFIKYSQAEIAKLKQFSTIATYDIEFKSITYLSLNRVEIKFNKLIKNNEEILNSQETRAIITFRFVDLDLSSQEILLNPLGFQVTSYILKQEKNL